MIALVNLLFGWEIFDAALGVGVATHAAQKFIKFLDFEQVEDSLGFKDAVLLEEEISQFAISTCNGFFVGIL